MKVTDNGYLDTQGFSVILYHSAFDRTFLDQKNTAMELILHGQRIATNGDIRLQPTPEQWDQAAHFKTRQADKEHNRLSAQLSYPEYQLDYRLEVIAEPGGVRVVVNLDKPLPERLVGRAGFNLEFLPSAYVGKAYMVDGASTGILPRTPRDPMMKAVPPTGEPARLPYQEEWDQARGFFQPEPFASGKAITLAIDDPLHRVRVESESGTLSLYDGRNRAQNGWFVLRTPIPAGKTDAAVVWRIRPDVIPNWTRPPMVAHSQAGYHPDYAKAAVIELDPKYDAPKTAKLLRLGENGAYTVAFEGPVTQPAPWLRYVYAKFDFTKVKEPGLYAIEYAGERTELFPIAKDVYGKTWQPSLDSYLATAMDHMSVREGYRLWHGVSHLDDARQAPPNRQHFDGWSMGPNLDSPYKPGEHIPGLNVGGWYDAGDFDIQTRSQFAVIQDLSLAYQEFGLKWDELTVDWKARSVEMHRPDGTPDTLEHIKHGVLQVLAQIKAVGHTFPVVEEPYLREYTHLGDGASKTDGRIYSDRLGPHEVEGAYSGIPDDRWAFTTKSAGMQYGSAATLAAAAQALRGYDDAMAKECLDTAVKIWDDEHANPTPARQGGGFPGMAAADEWSAALQLLIATNGAEPYKKRVAELFPTVSQRFFGFFGWTAVRALPYMDAAFKKQLEETVKTYVAQTDKELAATPFGVPPSRGGWGGSAQVIDLGVRMYFLHKAFPELVGKDYTLRAANYILGTHPVSSTSYVSAVGTRSKLRAYGNNRADNSFIAGGVIPGYVVIKPDFPECIDDFGFLWFENEYIITVASKWILAANAADALVR
ncbi:MAG: glycoside hydrolase family 9 protein [Acidobacteria bacterium]|nr:glycoside hydrolase family 9 protein [Acidobacteriota bacterium]